ncbi:MAG: hypothetical protein H7177_06150 [Rhizobacter sp.]|nr:hypothetical protein [Bacteriovorax sp.]
MDSNSQKNIYDLVVIGNGIAAQYFLWNLSNTDSKSQNFSIAHIYSKEIAPPCSLRSSATVSLNGIEEDVSQLGNDMREAFFLFDDLYKNHRPEGVEEITRTVVSTNENDTKKLTRRYKVLKTVTSEKLKNHYPGAEYNSYVITPEVFSNWMSKKISIKKTDYPFFVKDMTEVENLFHLKLQNGEVVVAKKILFAIGAFAKIFEKFYSPPDSESIELKNMIKAGSYLERNINLGDKSFYLSIDGHQVLYRTNSFEQKLIIGSATTVGAFEATDVALLSELFLKLKDLLTFDIGIISDFKVVTGLRHKGPKRLVICSAIDSEKRLFRINGLYKNGYTLGLLAAKRMEKLIFTS